MKADMGSEKRHIITLQVENRAGVMARIAGLIAAKGYNIDSLSVGETLDRSVSRVTLVVRGNDSVVEQAVKQLNRLIDVIRITEFTDEEFIERELVLVKVNAKPNVRAEILRMVEIFRAKVVDVTPLSYTVELAGNDDKLNAFVEMLKPFGIQEFARTGKIAMARGHKAITKQGEETWKEAARKQVIGLVE